MLLIDPPKLSRLVTNEGSDCPARWFGVQTASEFPLWGTSISDETALRLGHQISLFSVLNFTKTSRML